MCIKKLTNYKIEHFKNNMFKLKTEIGNFTIIQDRSNNNIYYSFAEKYGDYNNLYYYLDIPKLNSCLYFPIKSKNRSDRESLLNLAIEESKTIRDSIEEIQRKSEIDSIYYDITERI